MSGIESLIDLHMHTFLSDGALLPSELAQRCIAAGYTAMAFTDHADSSNMEAVLGAVCTVANDFNSRSDINLCILPGVEITHVIPSMIGELTDRARSLGAKIVVMHGQTVTEPVPEGTNRAAIEAGVDILAHPGLIAKEDVELARDRGVFLEITTRSSHGITNGHVARLAREVGAEMVLNTDTHSPGDILSPHLRERTILGAGLGADYIEKMAVNSLRLVEKLMGKTLN